MKFRKGIFLIASMLLLVSACANKAPISEQILGAESALLEGAARDYILQPDMLSNGCSPANTGQENSNARVLELREDGAAYLTATGRLNGWHIQYDCTKDPSFIVSVVVIYDGLEGPIQALSREWHAEVWELIDSGALEQLTDMPGLGANQIVFQDSNGAIGVEFSYRNVYFFLTGTAESGADNYDFFADLAAAQIEGAQSSAK